MGILKGVRFMFNWKNAKVGMKVAWTYNEFDGCRTVYGSVTELHDDHIIVKADGMNLWCDDFNSEMFTGVTK